MRTKHSTVPAVSAAYKPFVTEYRLSFKDPTSSLQKGHTITAKSTLSHRIKSRKQKEEPTKKDAVQILRELKEKHDGSDGKNKATSSEIAKNSLVFPPINPIAGVPTQRNPHHFHVWEDQETLPNSFETTSLTLPGMINTNQSHLVQHCRRRRVLNPAEMVNMHSQRYNIISGETVPGEPYTGFKEGRRAVVQSFANIDLTTNARTPGYNIITGYDPLINLTETELLKLGIDPKYAHA